MTLGGATLMIGIALRAVAYSLIPLAAAAIGGTLAVARPPGPRVRSAVQHFAAGVVFAAAAIEVLPEVMRHTPRVAIIGFTIGIALMLAVRWLAQRAERRGGADATGLIAVTGVDLLVDGLVLGAGFAAGGQTGILLTIALALEFLFVGLAVAAALAGRASWPRVVAAPVGLALLATLGAGVGALVLGSAPSGVLGTVLAIGAVALMYLVTEELLVEAHESGETATGTALFFVGFLVYLLIEEFARGGA